ncbi:MAG: PTS system mannose/fructose/sorbose family transporter subunit IID [Lactobacillales bacterium]|jgi:fructoselysine and glucoselysine-specific PTS system IID component|nr:PTS system mannose/fructose/sorbose family transporter subunit IID [Lactobacillales bacterium]
MTTNSKEITLPNSKITRKDFWSVFFRSLTLDVSWNYERMQNLAYAYAMAPIIRRLYNTPEERKMALERHLEFMSVTPHISTLLLGISGAMEEENSKNDDFNSASINAVKSSLMGPMAGIGDSFFWGTLKIIATRVAISLSKQGNYFGPLVFLLIINVPHFILRYICLDKGFKIGTKFFNDVENSGVIEKVTELASILGLMVIGGMTASNVVFELTMKVGGGKIATPLQDYVNEIMLGFFPACFFLICYWLLGKKVKTTTLLIGVIVFSILISLVGLA